MTSLLGRLRARTEDSRLEQRLESLENAIVTLAGSLPAPVQAAPPPPPPRPDWSDWSDWRGAGVAAGLTLLGPQDFQDPLDRTGLEAAFRARCHAVPLDPHTILCRVLGRYKVMVDSRDVGLAPHLMLDGYWEFAVTAAIARLMREGGVAYDVGANIGYYSLLMADVAGPQGFVHAVEPNPRMAELARRNLSLNGFSGHTTLHQAAASERAGQVFRFVVQTADPKNGRLAPPALPVRGVASGQEEHAVKSVALDDLDDRPADLIKIDVEGAEEAAWAGMQRLLDRSPAVTLLLEFNARRCADPAALIAAIAERYPMLELSPHGLIRQVERAELMERSEDTMLYLTRA